jgi:uncharacterized protein
MMPDKVDGFLRTDWHRPNQLESKAMATQEMGAKVLMPPMDSIEELNHLLRLVMRHFSDIIATLEDDPRQISPCWSVLIYDSDEYDETEG